MDSAECVPQDEKLSNRYQLFTLKVKKIMKSKTSTHADYNNFNTINKPGTVREIAKTVYIRSYDMIGRGKTKTNHIDREGLKRVKFL